jgi:rhamnose transport system permease protein
MGIGRTHQRETAIAVTLALLLLVLAILAPSYFSHENMADLLLANTPVMIIAPGMMLIILTGQIDISVGSVFAIAGIVSGLCARAGMPGAVGALAACLAGAACGALNGALVAYVGVPSIVVTLASMVTLRDGLRWLTQGAWIGGLPASFQWFGLTQGSYTAMVAALVVALIAGMALGLRYHHAGRAVYATGSSE